MDIINKNYSSDLRNLIVFVRFLGSNWFLFGTRLIDRFFVVAFSRYLLSTSPSSRSKSIQEVMPMIGARFFSQLEAATLHADVLEDQLTRELDNGRLFRLLIKLGTVVDRPEYFI